WTRVVRSMLGSWGTGHSSWVQRVPDHSMAVLDITESAGRVPVYTAPSRTSTPPASAWLATTPASAGSTGITGPHSERPHNAPASASHRRRASANTCSATAGSGGIGGGNGTGQGQHQQGPGLGSDRGHGRSPARQGTGAARP